MKVTIEESEKSVTLDGKAIANAVSKANYDPGLQAEQEEASEIENLEIKLDVKPKEDFEIPASNKDNSAFDGHSVGNSMERGKRIYWNQTFSEACEEILDVLVKHKVCMWDLNTALTFSNNILSGHGGEILWDKDLSELCKEIVYTILKHKIAPDDAKTVFKYVYHLARQNSPVVEKYPY
ncbi:hypothetical protein [Caproiciproducens galactitolivorans]|uniref:Uncharacterized protein n=1 Tax=Caproiciproducens galactitolivorans TaxID=642589 RepID=A0ABT4BSA8_9FIRM|nr:hypothetical protein [Caproiciproducens galactitolivorans]MCY1713729.1 hypothetical protein [Caproiciproducens galactitolivorans]